jgi:Protein of unknown function (DUF2927)
MPSTPVSQRQTRIWSSVLAVLAAFANPALAQPNEDLRWAEDIVVRPDFILQAGESGTRRWMTAPKVSVMVGAKEHQQTVTEVVDHLNETLKKTSIKKIELLKPHSPSATLKLYFVPREQIAKRAESLGALPETVKFIDKEKLGRYAHLRWNPAKKYEMTGGFVVITSDKTDADRLKHNVLTTLCYQLGFMNFSKQDAESAFYRDGNTENNAEKLTARDQKLVIWYYNHVPPGTSSLAKLFKAHWPKD